MFGGYHGDEMLGALPSVDQWQEIGFGLAGEDPEEPIDWSQIGPGGYGAYVDSLGIIQGEALSGIGVEVEEEDWGGVLGARTPMLEIAPDDYMYMSFCGKPYHGMMAFGDTGEIYQYNGFAGFFKRLKRRVKRRIKKVARRVKGGIKKALKKTKFGRMILKVGGRIKKIAMKVVKPLTKYVGKFATKLAPICALVPGYGTAIAAGLAAAGKVAKLMKKYGVTTKGKKGKVRGLKLKDPRKLLAFQKALKTEASRMARSRRANPARFQRMLRDQQRRLAS